jgi:hypothetical protein
MSDVIAIVPQPKAPCQACVENARHQDETFGLVWCEHVRYGGEVLYSGPTTLLQRQLR